jgi:hypothetical protein
VDETTAAKIGKLIRSGALIVVKVHECAVTHSQTAQDFTDKQGATHRVYVMKTHGVLREPRIRKAAPERDRVGLRHGERQQQPGGAHDVVMTDLHNDAVATTRERLRKRRRASTPASNSRR